MRQLFPPCFLSLGAAAIAATVPVDFNREVRPILAENCLHCHGPDANKREGELRLDRPDGPDGAYRSKEAVTVIKPGDATASEFVIRVFSTDRDEVMPPRKSKHVLTDPQKQTLKRWVEEGAPWGKHWAFESPKTPAVPRVQHSAAARNPIDRFVLSGLEREGIEPSAEADRRTLIRRLSLDLIGLPPELQMVQTFVADERSDAYERLVETFLASPHFGERWGRYWLDLARYADSEGYLNDAARPFAYVYRDWVIDAINRDLPFDQFTIQQLAGDLLPGVTLEQKIATGFHRNTLKNAEAGADREEDRCKVAVDRVATTGAVWLGLTVGCAECHTHKYDPISQREFYALYAFFNNTDDADIPAPRPDEIAAAEKRKAGWEQQRETLLAAVDEYIAKKLPAAQAAWEQTAHASVNEWSVLAPRTAKSAGGATLTIQPDQAVVSSGKNAPTDIYTLELAGEVTGATGLRMEARGEAKKGRTVGRGRTGGAILSELTASVQRAAGGKAEPLSFRAAIAAYSPEESPITAAIDGDPSTGWSTSAKVGDDHRAVFEFTKPLTLKSGDKLVLTLDQRGGYGEAFRRLHFAVTTDAPPLGGDTITAEVSAVLATPPAARTVEQSTQLSRYYQQIDPGLREVRAALQQHAAKAPALPKTKAQTLVTSKPRETNVHVRGDFLRKGDRVNPGALAILHPFKPRAATAADRLDLANWLVDPANPLTSRVTVNHIWKNLFGRGLVPTVEDFGTRGEPPSHPELLDYLATEFIRCGWSRKEMIRLIVTSATYRQASATRPDLIERDPLNKLLARQNRNRLEAEVVRDVFLASSGLLNPKIGGPSIFPPLPAFVTAVGRDKSWPATNGAEQYRRGLYIHLRRSIPYPMLLTFDAPDTSVSCTRRDRSNTPLQALTLLNDPVFFGCCQTLGQKFAGSAGDLDERLRHSFEHCMSRPATAGEMQALRSLHDDQLRLTSGDAKAAMLAVTRVIMNLDEFITRE